MRKGKDSEDGPSRADGIKVPKKEDHVDLPRQTSGAAMKLTPVGIDIAKNVFQVHYVDEETGEVVNKPIKRAKRRCCINPAFGGDVYVRQYLREAGCSRQASHQHAPFRDNGRSKDGVGRPTRRTYQNISQRLPWPRCCRSYCTWRSSST